MTQDVRDLIAEARGSFKATNASANLIHRLTTAVEELLGERDAATEVAYADLVAERDDLEERLAGYLWDSTGGLLSKTGYDVRTMVTHTEEYYDKVHAEARKEAEADRDAAVAAIERVRAQHQVDEYTAGHTIVRCVCEEMWPCSTIQALDGAPEPEWEYRARTDYGRVVAQGSLDEIGHLSGHIWERRRKAGEWEEIPNE